MINDLKYQIEKDLYDIYPTIYEPVYKMKKKLNILCGSHYNTRVCTFEKIGENQIVLSIDNSFMGFCRDIFLNPNFDYFLSFKFNESCFHEITFEDICKTISAYNNCRDINKKIFQDIDINNFIELTNMQSINTTTNVSLQLCTIKSPSSSAFIGSKGNSYHALEKCEGVKHYPIPSFINKNNFIQGIKFGNSNCYTFIIELKDVFCVIKCTAS